MSKGSNNSETAERLPPPAHDTGECNHHQRALSASADTAWRRATVLDEGWGGKVGAIFGGCRDWKRQCLKNWIPKINQFSGHFSQGKFESNFPGPDLPKCVGKIGQFSE
jgi:hypothetical protein